MQQDGNETHICQLFVVLHQRTAHSGHHVASEEAKLRLRVVRLQATHQMGGVKVARRLAGNEVVFHSFQDFTRSMAL